MVSLLLVLGTCALPPADQQAVEGDARQVATPVSAIEPAVLTPAEGTSDPSAGDPPPETPPQPDDPMVPAVPPAPPASPPAPPPAPRTVAETAWTPFATVGGVVLHHPSSRVERVGFHESNHDGARQMEILPTAVAPVVMETRERGTGSQTAADVVADPDVEIRAPVTGTVLRAGRYVLYCDYSDDYVVIEPAAHPGWEVKILHIDGHEVHGGDRVEAGVTVLAGGPTPLPFSSQVDDHTGEPSWPHVHMEVVDPSIPNRPKPGSGC